ncbi:hypothetical protein DSM3645_02713 [Blastopirellula marina DSM 3645]|uniref:Uncharacterized protein n=1 Tax=Blastopirellula marina DSM 3645 TaxID=314230 RepID=A3ZVK6_9BACT|nr:hypothetical protein DSM3645_02713 [Blastopirellula marina DSM 3645]
MPAAVASIAIVAIRSAAFDAVDARQFGNGTGVSRCDRQFHESRLRRSLSSEIAGSRDGLRGRNWWIGSR